MWATGRGCGHASHLGTRIRAQDADISLSWGPIRVLEPVGCPRPGVDSLQWAGYVGPMSEYPDDTHTGSGTGTGPGSRTGHETGGQAEKGAAEVGGTEKGGAKESVRDKDDVRSESPEGDLSTKLDPDVIPQQGDTPEVERTREHPEETGS